MQVLAGIDIGGTKCAVSLGIAGNDSIEILSTISRPTPPRDFPGCLDMLINLLRDQLQSHPDWELTAIGISCGGPLDPANGLIFSPPNLPSWDAVDPVTPLSTIFHVPVQLRNDADACALAEWKMGAGKGTRNLLFLTFGTGMGAGLILNGKLYCGTNGMAGEVGHIRLADEGPQGYGKEGSFEGFCSGGGIADLGRRKARQALATGNPPLFCPDQAALATIDARAIALALLQGDPLAKEIYRTVAAYLGKGLAMLVDILNPELIVLGSIYLRQQEVLESGMWVELTREALPRSLTVCRIAPSALGERIGDYAALSVALDTLQEGSGR